VSQARSPRPLVEQVALDAVERHWAVKAVPIVTRRHARVAADRAWETVRDTHRVDAHRVDAHRVEGGATLARRLTKGEAGEIATVADAYERAANEARQAVIVEGMADATEARAMLRAAAAECFRLTRALPLETSGGHAWDAVRVAAFGVLGDAGAELRAWADHASAALHDPALPESTAAVVEQLPWDEALRYLLPKVWLALLREPGAHETEAPFEALGLLREARADAEARQVLELAAADAAHLQLALAGLYGVADAAAALVSHIRRTMRDDVTEWLDRAFVTARAAVPASTPLGRALPWVQLAAALIARRQSTQIALPGLLP
jgi:hypothetical protein